MNAFKRFGWAAALALLLGAVAFGQDTVSPPRVEEEATEETDDSGEEFQAIEGVGLEDGEATDQEAIDEIVIESAPSDEAAEDESPTGATMERFRPTEKISEDRSVAFPNDI